MVANSVLSFLELPNSQVTLVGRHCNIAYVQHHLLYTVLHVNLMVNLMVNKGIELK